jgi:hypothetical protein
MPAQDIDGVLEGLAAVVQQSRADNDRIGYFAALYRQVTLAVKQAVVAERFEDNPRMDRFDAEFGNRYFASLDTWRQDPRSGGCPRTWRDAFDLSGREDLAVVQHLLLGINAHINVDLAVAAARTAPGDAIDGLKNDFDLVNDILISVLDQIQQVLNDISPLMRLLDSLGNRLADEVLGFSVKRARGDAWQAAVLLARVPQSHERHAVSLLDSKARALGRLVAGRTLPLPQLLLVHNRTAGVDRIIERLDSALGTT